MTPTITWHLIAAVATVIAMAILGKLLGRFIRRRKYRLPPGPIGLPVLGHVRLMNHISLFEHRDIYGDVSYVRAFGLDIVVLNSVEVIRDALLDKNTSEVFSGRPKSFLNAYILGDDLITTSIDAKNWKSLRNMFHSLLKQYGGGIVKIEEIVSKEIHETIKLLHTKSDRCVELQEFLEPSILNILFILLVGKRCDYSNIRIKDAAEVSRLVNVFSHPFMELLLQTFPFLRLLPFGPGSEFLQMDKCRKNVLDFLYRQYKNLPGDVLNKRKGMVFEMLTYRSKYPWISESNIEGIVMDTFGGGFVSTMSSLRAFFLIMLHYPRVQNLIQTEIDEIVGACRRPTLFDSVRMPYTNATIHELFRYTSIFPLGAAHSCTRDADFKGFTVPRGALIIPNLFRVHHDKNLWENPSDFMPERFLDKCGNLMPADHSRRKNLIPFRLGKRRCVAEVFAKTRIYLYITHLLQDFTFKPDKYLPPCHPTEYSPGIILRPPDYSVRIETRK